MDSRFARYCEDADVGCCASKPSRRVRDDRVSSVVSASAASEADGRVSRGTRTWGLLFGIAVVVQAAALTAWPRIVTVDGPAHLAGAAALLHSGDVSQALYRVDPTPVPNLLQTLLLAALLAVTGPDGAERMLVLAYAVGLPLAMRYALRGVQPQSGWLAVAAVPFVGGYLYTYGFYDFCLGLVGMLLVMGFALRQRTGWSATATATLSLLLLLTWIAHLLPLVVAGIFVVVLALCRVNMERRSGVRPALIVHALGPLVAELPVLALTVAFLVASAASRGAPIYRSSAAALLLGLVDLGRPLVAWTTWEYAGSSLVAVGLVTLAVLNRRSRPRSSERRALGVTGVLLTGWYLASPDRYGPAYGLLNDRLSLFPPLLLVLWCARPAPAHRAERLAVAILLVGTAALVGLRLPTEARYQGDVAEVMSVAPLVPRGSTLVALRLWRDPPFGPDARNRARDPLSHQAGRIAVLRGALDVGDFEAETPYFPLRFRAGTDPRRMIDRDLQGLELVPPSVDLTRGPQIVLLIGLTRATASTLIRPESVRLLSQLTTSYRLIATSRRSHLVEVWLRLRAAGSRPPSGPAVHEHRGTSATVALADG